MTYNIEKSAYVQPGRSDVHPVDVLLTNTSILEMQEDSDFVATKAFPVNPVSKASNRYFIYDRGDFTRDEMQLRAPSTESAGANYKISTDTYSTEVWGLHKDLDDQVRANADSPLNLEREIAIFLARKALLRLEVSWTSSFFTTSVWTTDQTGVASGPGANQFVKWSDDASTPIKDFKEGMRTVAARTGIRPNKIVMGRDVIDTLELHPDVIARIDSGQTPGGPAMTTRENLAALLGVNEILVLDAVINSAAEGATDSLDYNAAGAALLLHVPTAPGLMTPAAGYTFSWTGLLGGAAMAAQISRYDAPLLKSERFEIELAFDHKLTGADLGLFFASAL